MRVAIFTNTYYPTLNGVANCVDAYRRGLERRGHEVYIFAPCPKDFDPSGDPDNIFRFPAVPVPGDWDYDIAMPYSRPVMKTLRDVEFDLVHTQHPVWVGVWGAYFARWTGCPLVTTIHTDYEIYASILPLPDQLVSMYLKARVTSYCNKCQVVTTPAASRREGLLSQGIVAPIEIVPNPIDLSWFPEPDPARVRATYGIEEDQCLLGFIGRLAPEKNLETVIDAAAIVMGELPEARFLMVGDGVEMKPLQEYVGRLDIADRFTFVGAVEHREVPHYQASLDVFMTASMSETQPLSYTEAMALGTPVVALRAPGAQDMIEHGKNGLLSEPKDGPEGLAAEVLRLAGDPRERAAIAETAREHVGRYDIDVVTERLLEVYELAKERYEAEET